MKKNLFLALLFTAGCAFAETPAEMNNQLVYLRTLYDVTGSDYTLAYTIDSRVSGIAGGNVLKLADGYYLKAQTNDAADSSYIGLQMSAGEGDNRSIAHSADNKVNTYTVDATKVDESGKKPADKVVGWVTTDATGSGNSGKNFDGSTVTVASTTAEGSAGSSITIAMQQQELTHVIKNTATLNVGDLEFQSSASSNKFTYSGLSLNGHTMADSVLTKQEITSTVGATGYAGKTVFNFAIYPGQSVQTGDVIAGYFDPNQKFGGANYFTLTKDGENVYFTANMGSWSGTADAPSFAQDSAFTGKRQLTLNGTGAALTIGEEYTVIINGSSGTQTVYLFDSNQVLKASGTYNGNINGGLSSGSYATYMNSAFVAPEPATATLSLLALAGLMARRKRH